LSAHSSHIAWPTPCAAPPWVCPCTISGYATPDIVDDGVAGDVDPAGLGIDLDLAHGTAIGKQQASGPIDFQYDDDWLAWEQTFLVSLSLPLRENRFIGDPVIAVLPNSLVPSRLAQGFPRIGRRLTPSTRGCYPPGYP
jgi:hypothetical protein